jgi:hypothetical protein
MSNDESSGAYGVSPDEPKAKSALVRGFESPLPHHDLPSVSSVVAADFIVRG